MQIALGLKRWRQRYSGSVNQLIFSAALIVAGMTFGVKLVSAIKDIVVAATFGTSDMMDAFILAFLLPSYVVNVVAASFKEAMIPTYIRYREQHGHQPASNIFTSSSIIGIVLLLGVTGLLYLASPSLLPYLGMGFSAPKLQLTQELFNIFLPVIILSGIATFWESALNASERFALVAFAPAAVPTAMMVALWGFGASNGIYALAYGMIAGFMVQLLLLGIGVSRQKISILPRWSGMNDGIRSIMLNYRSLLVGAMLVNSSMLVDQAMASSLSPGSVSALGYGNKLVALVVGITTMALGTALLPYLSRLVAARNWNGLRHTLRTYTVLTLAFTIPVTLVYVLLSTQIVQIVFQRGAFTAADTELVARIQAVYALQIPFHTLGILFVRLIISMRASHIVMWGSALFLVANIVFDLILIQFIGVVGIALSTTLVYITSMTYLAIMAYRLMRKSEQT